MNNVELTNKLINTFQKLSSDSIRRREFTPRELAIMVDGYAPAVGKVAENVIRSLAEKSISVRYEKKNSKRIFILSK